MKVFIFIWLCVPLLALAYHFGPGKELLSRDLLQDEIDAAYAHVEREEYADAVDALEALLQKLGSGDEALRLKVRLQLAQTRMFNSQLPQAHQELEQLVAELEEKSEADPGIVKDARTALASSQFFMTYLMKLEELPREHWEPEIEAARQELKLQVKRAKAKGEATNQIEKDLEAVIRLARADISDLQGRAIPEP